MTSSRVRGVFERLRLFMSIGRMPQSRLEQIRLKIDRLSLSFPRNVPSHEAPSVPPIIIGAVGGSGTRVVAEVLQKAGWFMGARRDSRNEDSLPIACFLTKWLKTVKDFPQVDARTLARVNRDFERMLYIHRRGIPSSTARWGWKNPRSMWLIPFFVDRFPKMRFVHVIRDARDMMLSENRYFLKDHGAWVLGPDWWRNPVAAQLQLWRLGNQRALEFGQRYLGNRYHMIRYEDLCQRPAETVSRLLQFLEAPEVNVRPLIEGIRDRGNIGRWRRVGTAEVAHLGRDVRADLERFGYEL